MDEETYWQTRMSSDGGVIMWAQLREMTRLYEEIKASKNHILRDRLDKLAANIESVATVLGVGK